MNNSFGTSGYGVCTTEIKQNKYPVYTNTFYGTQAQVQATGSMYYSHGWDVTYTNGNPWTGVAKLECNVQGDGITPDTGTTGSLPVTVNWSIHYKTCDKELLQCNVDRVPWLSQINPYQWSTLENAFTNPPQDGVLPSDFNGPYSGSTPPAYSGSMTAGDVVWTMWQMGFRTVPINTPILRLSMTVNSGFDLTFYTANVDRMYAKSTLTSILGIPSNFVSAMPQGSDPSTSTTKNILFLYGWLQQTPTIDQTGITTQIQQEWEYGLYPTNIYGIRL